MAESLADATGLSITEATNLLAAAGGNLDLAIELHFDGAWTALAIEQQQQTPEPEPLRATQQRFSVLSVDEEDVEKGIGDSDEDDAIFALTAGCNCVDSAGGASSSSRAGGNGGSSSSGGNKPHGNDGRRSKARSKGGGVLGNEYDMLALTAELDEEISLTAGADGELLSRREQRKNKSEKGK